jgi:hypothetical protein
MVRRGCCSVGMTITSGDGGHVPSGIVYTFDWLPHGSAPTRDDKSVGVLVVPEFLEGNLARGERHPIIEAVALAIERYLLAHPEDAMLLPPSAAKDKAI